MQRILLPIALPTMTLVTNLLNILLIVQHWPLIALRLALYIA